MALRIDAKVKVSPIWTVDYLAERLIDVMPGPGICCAIYRRTAGVSRLVADTDQRQPAGGRH